VGTSVEEAFVSYQDYLRKSNISFGLKFPLSGITGSFRANYDNSELLKYEVMDQYRAFQLLEHFIANPILLGSQSLCAIPSDLQSTLVDTYWTLDDNFVRELLNKRLNKSRKDLEDIADCTYMNLRRVTRQYDNIKRIYNAFEENSAIQTVNIFTFIYQQFKLSDSLAKKYACIVYLIISKFNLTTKRRVHKLPCVSLENCAVLIISFLSDSGFVSTLLRIHEESNPIPVNEGERGKSTSPWDNDSCCWKATWEIFPTVDSLELDKQLLVNLRDLKSNLSGDMLELGVRTVRAALRPELSRKIEGGGSSRISSIIKSLLQIGANLSQSREFRDLFEDLLTKVAEPLEELGVTTLELNEFLMVCCKWAVEGIPVNSGALLSRQDSTTSAIGSHSTKTDHLPATPSTTALHLSASVGTGSIGSSSIVLSAPSGISHSSIGSSAPLTTIGSNLVVSDGRAAAALPLASNSSQRGRLTKGEAMKMDWARFVTFTRLCLSELVGSK